MTRRFAYAFRPWEPPSFYRPVLVAREVAAGDTIETAGLDGAAVRPGPRPDPVARACASARSPIRPTWSRLDDAAFEALAGVDTWVVGCFLRKGPHWTHADLPTVLGWVDRVRRAAPC